MALESSRGASTAAEKVSVPWLFRGPMFSVSVARMMVIVLGAKVRAGMTCLVMAIVLARRSLGGGHRADVIAVQSRFRCRRVRMVV
jgi:hypothetical protein